MYDVYSTKPGGDMKSGAWRWVLQLHEQNLTRREAAKLAREVKQQDSARRVIVYSFGAFKYAI